MLGKRVKQQIGYLFLGVLCILTHSCELIDYHPYDVRIKGETGINGRNTARIEADLAGKKHFRFALISDTQRWYDETEEMVQHINQQDDVDFVIHGGDQADFGMTQEFLWMRDIMNELNCPYTCIIGNHDCLGTGVETFKEVYGPLNYAFTAGNVRFLCLQTNALEYDDPLSVPNFTFLDEELEHTSPEVKRTIVVMHTQPYDYQFNNNVAKIFQAYLKQFPNLMFCLHGHGHKFQVNDLFNDGILYYECPSAGKRSYLLFDINENGYDYEVVEF